MRIYHPISKKLSQVVCNACGKKIPVKNEVMKEDVLHVEKQWGYFSGQDGEIQKFDICEECYKKIAEQFLIPVEKEDAKELI